MLKKIATLYSTALLFCAVATQFAAAECSTCATGGCATGDCGIVAGHGCPPGGCHVLARLRSRHHCQSGPCMTCDNIWDGYCASKPHCLPIANYPFQNCRLGRLHLPSRCNGCNSCNNQGVGIYGGNNCCGSSHCGHIKRLFAHKKHAPSCDTECCAEVGCDATGCADAGCAAGASGKSDGQNAQEDKPADTGASSWPNSGAQANDGTAVYKRKSPITIETSGARGSFAEPFQRSLPKELTSPTAPISQQRRAPASSNSFDWLQRALQLN